ncbi:MAG: hypothetical protein HC883_02840 [Bdellovibrionaceae bacterium]|nr:hypothetical protein [Pseudobdellovibrionaceae bacterium]
MLVHKNLGLFSDSLSHSLIPGIAGAIFFFGLKSRSISLGAIVWGIVVSILFSFLGGLSAKKRDSFWWSSRSWGSLRVLSSIRACSSRSTFRTFYSDRRS